MMNGRTRLILEVAGLVVALVIGVLAGGQFLGTQSATLESHVGDRSIHEEETVKRDRIDDRIRLYLEPLNVKLEYISEAQAAILEKLDEK
jgi:hypothetical protein